MKITTNIKDQKVTVQTTDQRNFYMINGSRIYSPSFRCAVLEGMLKATNKLLGA
jgi:hypothetical protein